MNYVLELHSYCATIVARNEEGYPFICRNADFFHADVLKQNTYMAKFVNKDLYLFDSVMLTGCVGSFTASKDKMFALSINLRVPQKTFTSYLINLGLLFLGSK